MPELQAVESKNKGFLGWIERVGNKMPHPFKMFMELTGIVLVLSLVLGLLKVSAVHPVSGKTITVLNYFSWEGLSLFAFNFIRSWQNFSVLGVVFIFSVATGVCEHTGLFHAAIKMGLSKAKGNLVVFVLALIGVISTNIAADAGFVIVPAIAAVVFLGLGRHPLAGAFLGYSTAAPGISLNAISPGVHMLLTPMTIAAAQSMDPGYSQTLMEQYYILAAGAFCVAIVSTIITVKVIEPRLGKYVPEGELAEGQGVDLTEEEKKAARFTGLIALVYIAVCLAAAVPFNNFLKSVPPDSTVIPPAARSILRYFEFLFVSLFLICGITYGVKVKKIKSVVDAVKVMQEGGKTMVPFLILVIAIAQFLFIFDKTNLAMILAIKGGLLLQSLSVPRPVIAILFLLLCAFINLFIGSASTKWLLLSSIFVPMFMMLGFSPVTTQVIYSFGDSSTNNLTPLLPYFAILLTTVQKYDKKAGFGTLFSCLLPYTGAMIVLYVVLTIVWMVFGLPTGIGGHLWLN